MRGLAEQRARLRQRGRGGEFEKRRHEVGKFGGAQVKPILLVKALQVDHRLAAVAAFAMHVLEEMQRQRARPIELVNVALLQRIEIAARNLFDSSVEQAAAV